MQTNHLDVAQKRAELLAAIEPEVPFEGWSEPAFASAVRAVGMDPALAKVLCPRGAIDLACEYHRAADRALAAALTQEPLAQDSIRGKVAAAVFQRLALVDPELVRRAASAFALPQNAASGARLMWETADTIWTALGDSSEDANWYSKRLMLTGVISASVLFWMGDESEGHSETQAFIAHRINDVMQIEKAKSQLLRLPGVGALMAAVRAPKEVPLPGRAGPYASGRGQ